MVIVYNYFYQNKTQIVNARFSIPHKRTIFANSALFARKSGEAVPSTKKLPTWRLVGKACIYMVSVKKF